MIKTIVRIVSVTAIITMLVLGLAPVHPAYAQGGLTWTSGFQVYNPGATGANVTFTYYNSSDGSVGGTVNDVIPATSSKTYFPITGVSAGFNGSLVISSDQPLVTVNNLVTPDFHYAASTNGFSSGSTSIGLPLIMCNNNGFNTFFSVQNAGGSDANITVTYTPNGTGFGVAASETATLHAGQSKIFDQTTGTATKNCSTMQDPVSHKFIGSVTVTSTQPVVAAGYSLNTTTYQSLSGYGGFAAGSTTVTLPLVMANNSGYWTGIQVQNVGSSAADVTITYGPNGGGSYAPTNDTCTALAPGQSCTVLQSGGAKWTNVTPNDHKFLGSATVTSTQPIVAIVNQANLSGGATNSKQAAFEGFDPAVATATLDMPLIYANNGGWYTGFQVMNVGTGSCNVTVTYGPNTGGVFAPVTEVFTLATSASKTVIQNGTTASNGSANNWSTAGRYLGSASAAGAGTGCKIVAVVNQVGLAGYDTFMSSDAFNR
jgi:hypothetical protein